MKYSVIILSTVLDAGALVVFAMIRYLSTRYGAVDTLLSDDLPTEQLNYMLQVLERNLDILADVAAEDYVQRHERSRISLLGTM